MLSIGLKLNEVAEILKIKNPEIRKNPEEYHTPVAIIFILSHAGNQCCFVHHWMRVHVQAWLASTNMDSYSGLSSWRLFLFSFCEILPNCTHRRTQVGSTDTLRKLHILGRAAHSYQNESGVYGL